MKTRLLLSISLSLLVLMGSGGILLSAHYCGGDLQHVSLFNEAASCHEQTGCHQQQMICCAEDEEEDSGCCHNMDLLADADLDYPSSTSDLDAQDQPILFQHWYQESSTPVVQKEQRVTAVDPPGDKLRRHVRFQVFRC